MSRLRNFNPYTYVAEKKYTKRLIFIFVFLSILMKTFMVLFSVKGWISKPQFTETIVKTVWFDAAIEGTTHLSYFRLFFLVDYVWAFLLLFLIGSYVYRKATSEKGKTRWFYWPFLIISIIAYVLDCIENTSYLLTHEYPEDIALCKVIAYSIVFIYVVVVIMYYSLKNRLVLIRDFISSAWISLLFLAIIGLTLPKTPQLNSIIVDLYYHPFWFVVILLGLFAPFYCIALSHYPTYFLLSKNNKNIGKKKWRIEDAVGLFGIIWHSSDSKQEKVERRKKFVYESNLGFLRRAIGVFFYMALFYMIAYTTDTNFDTHFSETTVFFLLLFLWVLYVLNKNKNRWYMHCKSEITPINYDDPKYDEDGNKIPSLHVEMITFISFLVATIVIHIVLLGLLIKFAYGDDCPYTLITVILSMICVLLQTITYMYYRTFRSVLKYTFFQDLKTVVNSFIITRDKSDERDPEEKKDKIRAIFKENETKEDDVTKKSPLFQLIAKTRIAFFSNNVIFLKVIAYFGMFNALFLVWINIWPTHALGVNSIIIVLSYFFLFYGMIVIILKHFLYYKSEADEILDKELILKLKIEKRETKIKEEVPKIKDIHERKFRLKIITEKIAELKVQLEEVKHAKKEPVAKQRNFLFTMYVSVLVIVVFNFLARFNEETRSNLFELNPIAETLPETELNLKTYAERLPDTRYYIGCYGGGMKANAWTMTVLNALDANDSLYHKTACLSGASGGTIGLINYSVIKHEIKSKKLQEEAIRNIGTENILSMDLTHVFGRDWLNHILVPYKGLKGKDRSTGAMKQYAQYSDANYYKNQDAYEFDQGKFDNLSYRHYWHKMYTANGKRFPILISNTTDISGRQGMAVSIPVKDNTAREILYEGATDILNLDGKTLSFYNAASTTNRFPLISPAATIPGKGQFNDGGIFENSGLLSAYKLYQAIDEVDGTEKEKTSIFINIINDKNAYIKWTIDAVMKHCKGEKLNVSNELSAILNSVAATEMFPNYVKDKLKLLDRLDDNICFKNIYLPHRFDFDDVKMIYGEEFKDLYCVDDIYAIIKDNNDEIKRLISKNENYKSNAVIEPEMSRVMAIPAFEFMQSMLNHSSIKKTIEDLK